MNIAVWFSANAVVIQILYWAKQLTADLIVILR